MTELNQAVEALRNTLERFIASAQKASPLNPVATKKMLEVSVEVQPAMEEVVKIATGTKK
jgi:hypothetical protein